MTGAASGGSAGCDGEGISSAKSRDVNPANITCSPMVIKPRWNMSQLSDPNERRRLRLAVKRFNHRHSITDYAGEGKAQVKAKRQN